MSLRFIEALVDQAYLLLCRIRRSVLVGLRRVDFDRLPLSLSWSVYSLHHILQHIKVVLKFLQSHAWWVLLVHNLRWVDRLLLQYRNNWRKLARWKTRCWLHDSLLRGTIDVGTWWDNDYYGRWLDRRRLINLFFGVNRRWWLKLFRL